MKGQRRRDTAPEVALRSELHRLGLRFRVDAPLPGLRRRADVLFTKSRVAVFIDGCFWHGCPEHGTWPKNNAEWWRRKIEANKARDADTEEQLNASGWLVVRAWEHDDPKGVAIAVQAAVQMRSPSAPNGGRKPT
jgi:DNA mismatch endonuclease (patch repair protein)